MPPILRRLNLSPRALVLAGAAIVVFILWRRGQDGDGGSSIEGPLTTIPPGTGEEGLTSVSNVPQVIPLPASGGIIHIPGEDPILVEPRPTPMPTPTPTGTKAPRWLRMFGRYWRPGQLNAFRAEWARRQRRARRGTGEAAWRNWLRGHPRVARFFGLPIPAAPAPSSAAAAPRAQPDKSLAGPQAATLNTPAAAAAVPGPGPVMRPRLPQRPPKRRRPAPPPPPRRVTTISGAHVLMPERPLRIPRSPRRRPALRR